MAACTPAPTATLFGTSFITSLSTSTSFLPAQTTTLPDETSTLTVTLTCTSNSTATPCTDLPVVTTSLTTIPGAVTTITRSIVTTIPVTVSTTSSPTLTLFSTCPTPNPNTPVVPVTTTPSPIITTSSSQSTLPGGQVITIVSTFTSTPPATTLFVSPPGLNDPGTANSSGSSTNLGAILGGSLGGFFGLLAIVAAFFCYRKRKKFDEFFEKDIRVGAHGIGDDDERDVTNLHLKPAPYQYGLVGHTASPSLSPPASPRLQPRQQDSSNSQHSRYSSATASMRSGESRTPLDPRNVNPFTTPDMSGQNTPHSRAFSAGDVPLLVRPLTAPQLGDRRLSSPTSPTRLPPTSFYITNDSENDASSSTRVRRPRSADANGPPPVRPPKSPRRQSSQQPVIVHRDGGRIDSPDTTSPVQSPHDDEPPAYSKQ